jgi:hypothetical protein
MASDGDEGGPRPAPATTTKPLDTDAFVAWLATVPDPVARYSLATEALNEHQEAVRRLSELRAGAVEDAAALDSLATVARRLGMSRQRVHQLVNEAKARRDRSSGVDHRQGCGRRRRDR